MATIKERLNLRIDEEDRDLFRLAADERRESLTQFLIESGRERAERLLADRNRFTIGLDDWLGLVKAMDRPATARAELIDLFSRPRPE